MQPELLGCTSRQAQRPVRAVVADKRARREGVSLLDDIVREAARRMVSAALEADVDAYLAELAGERDEQGRRLVVRTVMPRRGR
jgi:putative transposase